MVALAFISFGSLGADPVPRNLANGLYDVVIDSQTPAALQHSLVRKPTQGSRVLKYALKDRQGRILVDIHLDGSKSIGTLHKLVAAQPGVTVIAIDRSFQAGTIEAYLTPAAAAEIDNIVANYICPKSVLQRFDIVSKIHFSEYGGGKTELGFRS